MKYVSLIAISLLLLCTCVAAQQIEPQNEKKPVPNKSSGMTVQLMPYGYIELPRGYWAYMNTNWNDAWAGNIERFDGTSRIYFTAGLIQSPFEIYKEQIKWTKTSKIDDREFSYSLVETKTAKRVIVHINSAFFDYEIKDDAEIEAFLNIIGKYRAGRCESCFDSSWTKGMRKSLEKRFGER